MRKLKVLIIVAIVVLGAVAGGCKDDKSAKPEITVKIVEKEDTNYQPNQKEPVRINFHPEYEFKPLFSKAFKEEGYTVAVEFDFKVAGGIRSIEVEGANVLADNTDPESGEPFHVTDRNMFDSGTRHIETFLVKPKYENGVMQNMFFTISVTDREKQNTKADILINFMAPYYFVKNISCKSSDVRAWYYSLKHDEKFEEADIGRPDKPQREDVDFAFVYSNTAGGAIVYDLEDDKTLFKKLEKSDENNPTDWWNSTTGDVGSTEKLNNGDMYFFQNNNYKGALIVEGETVDDNNVREITIRVINRKETFDDLLKALDETGNDNDDDEDNDDDDDDDVEPEE